MFAGQKFANPKRQEKGQKQTKSNSTNGNGIKLMCPGGGGETQKKASKKESKTHCWCLRHAQTGEMGCASASH